MAALLTPTIPTSNLRSFPPFYFITPPQPSSLTNHHYPQWQLKQFKKQKLLALCTSYEVGGGYSDEELKSRGKSVKTRQEPELPKWAPSQYEAIIKGGEQVVSVLQEVAKLDANVSRATSVGKSHTALSPTWISSCADCGFELGVSVDTLLSRAGSFVPTESSACFGSRMQRLDIFPQRLQLEDMNMDEASEKLAVELAAHGVIGKRVDEMESGFMMALDYMIELAENDEDDKRKSLLVVIKETVLSHLTKKCPPHVQVVGLLCRTPQKDSRHELLRRVAAGGGVFQGENGTKVHLPGANLNDIANQADDILETMESRPVVPDRKLLTRLVLIREEARNMMGGGMLDERNDRGLTTLPESEVNFLTKLVALKPGKTVEEMIKNVMQGKDEGADNSSTDKENAADFSSGIAGRGSVSGRKPLPVRPGMFLETVSKVLGGIYAGNISGITAQHLEWVSGASFCAPRLVLGAQSHLPLAERPKQSSVWTCSKGVDST
ncbi:hypothetical protein RHMOL_Rhmol13G0065200 [Rhododendron molle]|uniref:Uncharacterized protein n=1 Tax=Rhododendron molle TaxID=49168 RepID=A0ACC0L555_RHOML|nr:hypothetical protein RHMOL_Rhmol13G0065200 [Rhododendron molle]